MRNAFIGDYQWYSSFNISHLSFIFYKKNNMEAWKLDFEWLQVRHKVKEMMHLDKLPDLNGVLFLVGVQEYGRTKEKFTKEEKQDLMHIAICELLIPDGYYEFIGRDEAGWPHYETLKTISTKGVQNQERLLIEKVVHYFKGI